MATTVKSQSSKVSTSKSKIAASAANVKNTASKAASTAKKELADDVKQKLFQKLTANVKKEYQTNGIKLVKTYGKDAATKSAVESFNEKINNDILKKMDKVNYNDTKKIKKEFKSMNDKILKEATKTEKILNGKGKGTKDMTASTTSAASSGSSKGEGGFKSCVQETVNKTQLLVDNYANSCETGVVPKEGWFSSIFKMFGFGR